MKDVLHVEREKEEHREKAGERGQLGDVGVSEPVDPEDRQRRQRVAVAQLVDYEPDQQRERARRARRSCGRCPSRSWTPSRARRRASASRPVTRTAPSTSKFRSCARRRSPLISRKIPPSTSTAAIGLTNITQRQPGPSVSTPAEQHAGGGREPANAAPDSDRRVPVLALPERGRQDRERGRKHHRCTHALQPGGRRSGRPRFPASPPMNEETPSSTVPQTSTRRRPSRSAARPPSSMNPP